MSKTESPWPWWIWHRTKSGRYVAWSDELGLTVEFDSASDLLERIEEAQNVLRDDLTVSGDLADFLKVRGWEKWPDFVTIVEQRPTPSGWTETG